MKDWILSVTLAIIFVCGVTATLAFILPTGKDITPAIKVLIGE